MVLQIDKDNISENYLKSESKFNTKTMKGIYLGLGDRQECLKSPYYCHCSGTKGKTP